MCVPVKRRGKSQSKPSRPMGPQRTYSIWPSEGSASGAIIIFPPVNLLLLKVRNKAGARSHSGASSNLWGKARWRRPSEAGENGKNVAKLAPALESAIGEFADVGGKSEAEQIEVIKLAVGVAQANDVALATGAILQSFDSVLDAARSEIAQE